MQIRHAKSHSHRHNKEWKLWFFKRKIFAYSKFIPRDLLLFAGLRILFFFRCCSWWHYLLLLFSSSASSSSSTSIDLICSSQAKAEAEANDIHTTKCQWKRLSFAVVYYFMLFDFCFHFVFILFFYICKTVSSISSSQMKLQQLKCVSLNYSPFPFDTQWYHALCTVPNSSFQSCAREHIPSFSLSHFLMLQYFILAQALIQVCVFFFSFRIEVFSFLFLIRNMESKNKVTHKRKNFATELRNSGYKICVLYAHMHKTKMEKIWKKASIQP